MLRYGVAFAIALLVIGLGVLYVWSTTQMLHLKRESAPSQSVFVDEADPSDFGMEVTEIEMQRILLTNLLVNYSPILITLILGIAWAIAARMQPGSPPHQ
jgi:hypothetical protein